MYGDTFRIHSCQGRYFEFEHTVVCDLEKLFNETDTMKTIVERVAQQLTDKIVDCIIDEVYSKIDLDMISKEVQNKIISDHLSNIISQIDLKAISNMATLSVGKDIGKQIMNGI